MSWLGKLRSGLAILAALSLYLLCALDSSQASSMAPRPQASSAAPQNDLAAQESVLRRAVRQTPNDPKALARLGEILAMQNKLDESVSWLEKALKLAPRDVEARRTLATAYWQLGQPEKARTNLELVLHVWPNDGWATLLLGMVSEDLGDHARAVRLLTAVLPRVRQRPEPILVLARAHYQQKEVAKAREALGYLNDLPNNSKGLFDGGRTAAEFHDYQTAETIFRSIQSTYPDSGEVEFNLALAQYSQQQYDESQKTLLASVSSGHATANAYELLGWTYEQQDRLEDMMKAFEKAINMEPGQESHFLELGQALLEKRNAQTALEVAEEAVKRFPESSRAYSLKGSSELRMSRLTEALRSYGKAVELDPHDPKAALGLALTYWNASQNADAEKSFVEAARKFPNEALIQLKYAIFLMNSAEEKTPEREAQIKALLKRSEQLDSSNAETHFNLGNIALKENNYEEALREFAEASNLDPEMAKGHFALARVYRRLGKAEDAAKETELYTKLKAKEEQKSEAAGISTHHQ